MLDFENDDHLSYLATKKTNFSLSLPGHNDGCFRRVHFEEKLKASELCRHTKNEKQHSEVVKGGEQTWIYMNEDYKRA